MRVLALGVEERYRSSGVGAAFYAPTTRTFPKAYKGDYFFADYVNNWIDVVNADGTGARQQIR